MDIDKQIEYINLELKKSPKSTVNKLCDKMGIKQSTFKTRVHRAGYKFDFDNRRYLKDGQAYDANDTVVINNKPIEVNSVDSVVVANRKDNDISNTLVIDDENIKNNLINLANNYDKIMALINNDKMYDQRYDGITIQLPNETIKDYRTTIRVNNVVWEEFNAFVNKNKAFTKKDLLSMALKEYIDKVMK